MGISRYQILVGNLKNKKQSKKTLILEEV